MVLLGVKSNENGAFRPSQVMSQTVAFLSAARRGPQTIRRGWTENSNANSRVPLTNSSTVDAIDVALTIFSIALYIVETYLSGGERSLRMVTRCGAARERVANRVMPLPNPTRIFQRVCTGDVMLGEIWLAEVLTSTSLLAFYGYRLCSSTAPRDFCFTPGAMLDLATSAPVLLTLLLAPPSSLHAVSILRVLRVLRTFSFAAELTLQPVTKQVWVLCRRSAVRGSILVWDVLFRCIERRAVRLAWRRGLIRRFSAAAAW